MNCKHIICPVLEISLIPLTQGKYAIVHTEDYGCLMQHKWCAVKCGYTYYAQRKERHSPFGRLKQRTILMHRIILNAAWNECVDHANHNGLDNRVSNIRTCSNRQNQQNQFLWRQGASKHKGVSRAGNNWRARIGYNCKEIYVGSFKSETEAAHAYDKKAKELFGDFACLNFPENTRLERSM